MSTTNTTRAGTVYRPSPGDWKLWKQMAALEPELDELRQVVLKVRLVPEEMRLKPFCANAHWYGRHGFRRWMSKLVGCNTLSTTDPLLRSSRAYDAAYNVLYSLLPDCSHDGTCWSEPPEPAIKLKSLDAVDLLAMNSDKLAAHGLARFYADRLVERLPDLDDICAPAPKSETIALYQEVKRIMAKLEQSISLLTP